MTIDEAIKHCLDIADGQDKCAEISVSEHAKERISQCAADHRQLAEWLTELKGLREENKVLISECDRLIKEKGELLKKSEQIAEYKRLLKAAVEDFKVIGKALDADCDILINCEECPLQSGHYNCRSWNHQDEALALIGEDGESNE